jgi:hypothetical protein
VEIQDDGLWRLLETGVEVASGDDARATKADAMRIALAYVEEAGEE